ncbi:MAG: PmoA family protein [Pirellulales bacterium]
MSAAGSKNVRYIELADRDHGTIASKIPDATDEVARTMLDTIRGAAPATEKIVHLHTKETDSTVTIFADDQPIMVYNKVSPPVPDGIDAVYARSGFLHPVMSPAGRTVTAAYPADHAHQHGIFGAWVDTSYGNAQVDFWNLAKKQGRVEHERTVRIVNEAGRSGFEADLLHRVLDDVDKPVLREHWKVTAVPRSDAVCFEIETHQEALTDKPLVIKKYHYGGMAYRGPVSWLTDKDGDKLTAALKREPSSMFNSEGQDRIAGNHAHARWVAVTGEIEGHTVTIAVFDDPNNFRAPQASRLHPTKPYFCFSPCVDGEFTIDRDHPFQSRYRFMVYDKRPEPGDIEREWRQWTLR